MKVLVLGEDTFAGGHAAAALADRGEVTHREFAGADAVLDCRVLHSPLARLRMRRGPDPALAESVAAARAARVRRYVLLSSALAYGQEQSVRLDEASPARPAHNCERLLLQDEEWLRSVPQLEVVVVRAAQPFGPGEPVCAAWLSRAAGGRLRLAGGGRAPRTFISGPDLGRALAAAVVRGRPRGVYLAGGFDASWRELFEAVAAVSGRPLHVADVPYDLMYIGATITELRTPAGAECWPNMLGVDMVAKPLVLDSSRTRRELTWSPKVADFAESRDLAAMLERAAPAVTT